MESEAQNPFLRLGVQRLLDSSSKGWPNTRSESAGSRLSSKHFPRAAISAQVGLLVLLNVAASAGSLQQVLRTVLREPADWGAEDPIKRQASA